MFVRLNRTLALLAATLSALCVAAPVQAEYYNVLAFDNGTVLRSYSSEYGGRTATQWIALGLIDGEAATGWASKADAPPPHEFLFELPTAYEITGFNFDTSQTEESGYPGISARTIEIETSSDRLDGPWFPAWSGTIEPGAVTSISLDQIVAANYLRLRITDNGGDARYTELMEFEAIGEPISFMPDAELVEGTYLTNWGPFFVIRADGQVRGCYDFDSGRFDGAVSGNFLNITWRENTTQVGKAVMAITRDGSFMNGFWYERGVKQGTWFGPYAPDAEPPACAATLIGNAKSSVEQSLDDNGNATLYGIYFDTDSAELRFESDPTLNQILKWLNDNPEKSLLFSGHTDADGSEKHNFSLSFNRAQSVVTWLTEHGVENARLAAKGFGETMPVADNLTPAGKALNRRVEVELQ